MFLNSKILSFSFLILILLCANSCLVKKDKGLKIREMSFEDICKTIDGEWAIYEIKNGAKDCRKKSCRTGIGLIRFECSEKKILGEHFTGAKTVTGQEQWDKVTAESEKDKIILSLNIYDKKDSNTEYKVTYEVEEVRDNRLFGKYTMRQVSNDRLVHDTRFIATKKLRTWKPHKP